MGTEVLIVRHFIDVFMHRFPLKVKSNGDSEIIKGTICLYKFIYIQYYHLMMGGARHHPHLHIPHPWPLSLSLVSIRTHAPPFTKPVVLNFSQQTSILLLSHFPLSLSLSLYQIQFNLWMHLIALRFESEMCKVNTHTHSKIGRRSKIIYEFYLTTANKNTTITLLSSPH